MDDSKGWDPLTSPDRGSSSSSSRKKATDNSEVVTGIGNGLMATSFTKLARVHVLSVIGDGAIAVALAGSIFFSIDPVDARWRVALYLVLTIAPFAIVTPLLGPAIDRAAGGRRGMVIGSLALRVVLAMLMSRHIDSLLLFPEAFVMLVLQKAYGVSRAALVPAVCPREDELIEANSKLSLLSSIGGVIGGAMGVGLIAIFGNQASTFLAAIVYVFGVVAAIKLPQVQVAPKPVDETEKLEVRGANIVLAATAIAVLRGIVGFTTFLLAFHLRSGEDGVDVSQEGSLLGAALGTLRDEGYNPDVMPGLMTATGPPDWYLGATGLAVGGGAFLGAKFAPDIRNRTSEERIVLGAIATVAIAAFLGGWGGGIQGIVVYAFGVAISASVGKLGFDALVQRDAPRSNHGRAFAQFEGRFQLSWAVGAFIAVVGRFPISAGAFIVALAAGFAALSYELGRRTDKVQASVRVREAIRDRVPQKAVDKIESHKAVQTVRPVLGRFAQIGKTLFTAGDSSVTAAPEVAAPVDPPPPPPPSASSPPPPPPAPGQETTTDDSAKHDDSGEERAEASDKPEPPEVLDKTDVLELPDDSDTKEVRSDSANQTRSKRATVDARVPTGEITVPAIEPQVSGDGVWADTGDASEDDDKNEEQQYRLWD